MQIRVHPRTILTILLWSIAVLIGLHIIAGQIVLNNNLPPDAAAVAHLFNMDEEMSLPTWFSQIALLVAGLSALIVGLSKRQSREQYYRYWLGIAGLLIYMSADEGARIHELAANPLMEIFGTEGTWLHFAWVIGGAGIVAIVGLIYARFWWRLPSRTRTLLLVSGAVYLGGAMGVELIGGYYVSNIGIDGVYSLLACLEESMEMVGASLAAYTFLDYQVTHRPKTTIVVAKK